MTRKEKTIMQLFDVMPALTDKQRERIIKAEYPTPELLARHPRTNGYFHDPYVAVMQSYKGYAVARLFQLSFRIARGAVANMEMDEIGRTFYSEDGEKFIVCRHLRPMGWYTRRLFSWYSPYHFCYDKQSNAYINMNHMYVHCVFSVPAWLRKRGWRADISTYDIPKFFTPYGEAIGKWGYASIFRKITSDEIDVNLYSALRICHRNNYVIRNYSDYYDYVKQLVKLGLDVHNAHYVCPVDFDAAHQQLTERIARRDARIMEARRREVMKMQEANAKAYESEFIKRLGDYLSTRIEDKNLLIRPLQSVAEFFEEGRAMHHCVAGYYDQKDTLILTARDAEGNRLATIEVRISTGKIIQCRAACNAVPPRKDEICKVINDNMYLLTHPNKQQKVA